MKTLRQVSAATILSVTLAISAFAGHMETPGAVGSGPRPTSTTTTTTTVTTYVVLTMTNLIYP